MKQKGIERNEMERLEYVSRRSRNLTENKRQSPGRRIYSYPPSSHRLCNRSGLMSGLLIIPGRQTSEIRELGTNRQLAAR